MSIRFAAHVVLLILFWFLPLDETSAAPQPIAVMPATEASTQSPAVLDEPQPELERPTLWGEPTEVRVLIFMIDVDDVDSAQQSFAASVYYEARWNSPLLRHPGPGPLHRSVTEVWTPRLVIVNQQMAWPSFPGSVEISPDGEVVLRQQLKCGSKSDAAFRILLPR